MLRKTIISVLIILAFGLIRLPLETGLETSLRGKGLLEEPVEAGGLDKLGQTSAVVALGGLRSMLASYYNLKIHNSFMRGRWFDVEEQINVTTMLQPRSRYFWETGAWHLAYNASAWHFKDTDQPMAIRRVKQREYINKGLNFLKKGVEMNPDNLGLKQDLARMLSDRYKFPDYPEAAKYMEPVASAENATPLQKRTYFYMLAQIPGREREAYEYALSLYNENTQNRLHTVNCLIYVYQTRFNIPDEERLGLVQMFGSLDAALKAIKLFAGNTAQRYPKDGINKAIRELTILTGDLNHRGVPSSIAR